MGRKKKVGRPKMAKNTQKQGFPLRLRPDLIKDIKRAAKKNGFKPGPYVEDVLEEHMEYERIQCDGTAQTIPAPLTYSDEVENKH